MAAVEKLAAILLLVAGAALGAKIDPWRSYQLEESFKYADLDNILTLGEDSKQIIRLNHLPVSRSDFSLSFSNQRNVLFDFQLYIAKREVDPEEGYRGSFSKYGKYEYLSLGQNSFEIRTFGIPDIQPDVDM